MSCTKNTSKMPIDLGPLLKIQVPKPEIKPVGITPAQTIGGKIATQTQGRGDGIFSNVVNQFALLYSTVKGSTSTPATVPAMAAGATTGTGNFTDQAAQQSSQTTNGKEAFIWVLVALVAAKLFKLF